MSLLSKKQPSNLHKKKAVLLFLLTLVSIAVIAVIVALFSSSGSNPLVAPASAPTAEPEPASAPKIPAAAEQNDLLKIAVEAQGTEQKIAYLTFDDGPTKEVTPLILDVLKQYDVKATFFMLGKMIERNGDLAKRVYEEGHLLANHSYSHSYQELYATDQSFMAEIEKTNSLIKEITQEEPFPLIRFPGGGYNAGSYAAEKQRYKRLLQENGYYFADWNSLNGDAEGGTRSAEQLLARIKETSGVKNIVVLMHDAATKKTTPQALPAMIEYLKNKGYTFRRLDEIEYYGGENVRPVPNLEM